jgi:sterol desaturase/sphingolipid hydroxylase (fatty acid hydroxylase superfamily)
MLDDFLVSLDPRVLKYGLQVLKLLIWLVVLAAVFTPLERLFALHPTKIFRKGFLTDLGYYFVSSFVPALLLSVPLGLLAWSVHKFIPASFTSMMGALPFGVRVAGSLVVGEIGYYWGHRWSHEIPLLWRFHAVHHSAEHIDYLVNTRAHPVDMVFTRLCEMIPMYVLGLTSPLTRSGNLIPVLVILLGTFWGFFIHANVKWRFGFLEWLVATPGFHHWHHTNDGPAYINKNYASMLPGIDVLFGTMYLPKDKTPGCYGIDAPTPPRLVEQLIEPFLLWRKPAMPVQKEVQIEQVAEEHATTVSARTHEDNLLTSVQD